MNFSYSILFFLCPMIFLAGFIDSIAGGGGLISLTSYMACGLPPTMCLGTNKFSALVGGTIASVNYVKTKNFEIISLIPAFVFALIGSFLGSECSMLIDARIFKIILLCATPLIAILVVADKDYSSHEKNLGNTKKIIISGLVGLVAGFYDGFYGPGAGTFMQMGFILFAGISIKKSCGNARMVNWASNFAALLNYIRTGNVIYSIAIPCALCSIVGNYVGSSLAIKKDVKIVKPIMLVVVGLLFVKILLDFLGVSI